MNNVDIKNLPGGRDIVESTLENLGVQAIKRAGTGKPFSVKELVQDGIKAYIAGAVLNQIVDIGGNYNQRIGDIAQDRGEALKNTFADKFLSTNSDVKNAFDKAVVNVTNSVTLTSNCSLAKQQAFIKYAVGKANDLYQVLKDPAAREAMGNLAKGELHIKRKK